MRPRGPGGDADPADDWTDWEGKGGGAPPPLPRNLTLAARVFAALDSIRGRSPSGMGSPSLPMPIEEPRIETRGRALGLTGLRLALLIDQVTLFEHYWLRFEMQKIAEDMKRNHA